MSINVGYGIKKANFNICQTTTKTYMTFFIAVLETEFFISALYQIY